MIPPESYRPAPGWYRHGDCLPWYTGYCWTNETKPLPQANPLRDRGFTSKRTLVIGIIAVVLALVAVSAAIILARRAAPGIPVIREGARPGTDERFALQERLDPGRSGKGPFPGQDAAPAQPRLLAGPHRDGRRTGPHGRTPGSPRRRRPARRERGRSRRTRPARRGRATTPRGSDVSPLAAPGKSPNAINVVYCTYATSRGHAHIGARLYLPKEQATRTPPPTPTPDPGPITLTPRARRCPAL
jgi:hypothetical protein